MPCGLPPSPFDRAVRPQYVLASLCEHQADESAVPEHYQAYINTAKEGEFVKRAKERLARLAD